MGQPALAQRRRAPVEAPDPAGPRTGELAAVLSAGTAHIVLELAVSEPVAAAFNAAASIGFLVYLIRRARRTPGMARAWGFRADNLLPAARAQLPFLLAGAAGVLAIGAATGRLALPGAFWLTLVLYPVWGIAQQFALQNLLARNLAGLLRQPVALAGVAAALFSVSHVPRFDLAALTLVAGFFFTLAFRKTPNIWVVGLAHALLGSLAVYFVLRADPGAMILGFLTG